MATTEDDTHQAYGGFLWWAVLWAGSYLRPAIDILRGAARRVG